MSVNVRDPKNLTEDDMRALLYNDEDEDFYSVLDTVDPDEECSDNEPEITDEVDDVVDLLYCNTEAENSRCLSSAENGLVYHTKNGTTWNKLPIKKQSRRSAVNVIKTKPGLTQYSSQFTTEEEAFRLFFSKEMMDIIVTETNRKAEQIRNMWNDKHPTRIRIWKATNSVEIKAYMGLVISLGALQASGEPVELLWGTDRAYVRPIAPGVMSRTRFQTLSSIIRFDDYTTRDERKKNDKLAPIRTIFDSFVKCCKEAYNPGSHLTVDEQLVGFRGRCSFRVYMKSKPDKYGIKIWALADAANAYTVNMQVYLGKIGNKPEKNQGERVVLDLVEHLRPGHGITTDNFFTSLSLADKLLQKKLTLTGTLRANKAYIPNEFLPKPSYL